MGRRIGAGVAYAAMMLAAIVVSPRAPATPEASTETKATKGAPTKDLLAGLRDLGVLTAIALFATGWLTTSFYLRHFGLSINNLDWPYHSFYFYSLLPFSYIARNPSWGVPFIVGIGVLAAAHWRFPRKRPFIIGLAVLGLSAFLYPVTWLAAQTEAECIRRGGGSLSVTVVLGEDFTNEAGPRLAGEREIAALQSAIDRNAAILIAQSSSHYYILYQSDYREARVTDKFNRAPVFHLPVSSVRMLRTNAPSLPNRSSVPVGGACDA